MPTDGEIPEHDPLAESTRRGLRRLADRHATDVVPWSTVNALGRRRKRARVATAITACVVVVGGACAAIVTASGTSDHVSVAGPGGTTTTSSLPSSSTTSTAPTTTTPPTGCVGSACGTLPPPQTTPTAPASSTAPGPNHFGGTLTVQGKRTRTWSMAVGDPAEIDAELTNTTDHAIAPSDSRQPTSLATICTSDASGAHTLWWMTNAPTAPGGTAARSGTFEPTDQYLGTVTCEVDIVTTDMQGTTFDTTAGGDEAIATIVAPVTAVAPVTITVRPRPATTTTTAAPSTTTTTTTSTP
jgi:hypothetical protein